MLTRTTIPGILAMPPAPLMWAQERCERGPGAQYGVTAYQCSSCGMHSRNGHVTYQFFTAPQVLQVDSGSAIRSGDVIEAVDGKPITTQLGAEAFTRPSAGKHSITLRRGSDRLTVAAELSQPCVEMKPFWFLADSGKWGAKAFSRFP